MRANTRRDHRLAFDQVAARYDEGRPCFSVDLVGSIAGVAGLRPGDRVLEIGPGTGQLTGALLSFGLAVTAIEPGPRMRAVLAQHFGRSEGLEVVGADFEDFAAEVNYRAVFAANSFHWLDPARSYDHAADLLADGGHLCLVWNYPIVGSDVQARLNETVFLRHPDFAGNEPSLLQTVRESAADGRRQLVASGRFEPPWWQWRQERLQLGVDRYASLLVSYANVAVLDGAARAALALDVARELVALGIERVTATNHLYLLVARRAALVRPPREEHR